MPPTHVSQESYADYLVDAYSDLVLRVCYNHLESMHDARDACQTVFFKYLRKFADDPTPFVDTNHEKAWFIRCAINTCTDMHRDAWRRSTIPLDNAGEPQFALDPQLPSVLESNEEHARIYRALHKLSANQRQAVYLHYYEEYSVKEIAKLTGETPNTVSQHLSRARAKLRGILEGEQR